MIRNSGWNDRKIFTILILSHTQNCLHKQILPKELVVAFGEERYKEINWLSLCYYYCCFVGFFYFAVIGLFLWVLRVARVRLMIILILRESHKYYQWQRQGSFSALGLNWSHWQASLLPCPLFQIGTCSISTCGKINTVFIFLMIHCMDMAY